MCELLNRIWSRPRGEWTRVLRRELPALAGKMAEELLQGTPGLPAGAEDMDDELLRQALEEALLVVLGYQPPSERRASSAAEGTRQAHGHGGPRGRDRYADHGSGGNHENREDEIDATREDDRHDGRSRHHGHEEMRRSGGFGRGEHGSREEHTGREDHAGRRHEDEARHGQDRLRGHDGGSEGSGHGPGTPAAREPIRIPRPRRDEYGTPGHGVPGHGAPGQGAPGHGGFGHGGPYESAGPDPARQELFNALTVGDCGPTDVHLAELAAAADWPLPPAIRAVALATPGETQQLAAEMDDALAGMVGGQPCLLVPSPDDDDHVALEPLLRGRFAAVGHAVPLRDTASSLRWAMRLLALSPSRAGGEPRPVFVDDHLSTLMLLQDEPLAHALAARWLRPLADLTPRQSERLEVTLLAWLEGGGAPEAAKALSVHPQTVRYRMRQLEKLFGPDLRDPRTRFELEMALRSRRLMAQVRRQPVRSARRPRPVTTEFRPVGAGRMARVNGL
ncbi:helix-turn-helix domain-containing protein [Streptomyces sp. NPDC101132]|uniref:PucR family transcriptional regulator n=1 Tax=Streptomyces sp. NPDC101132 TaxID=3366110 RepID=UPI00380A69C8